jgi:hypothetical protein
VACLLLSAQLNIARGARRRGGWSGRQRAPLLLHARCCIACKASAPRLTGKPSHGVHWHSLRHCFAASRTPLAPPDPP